MAGSGSATSAWAPLRIGLFPTLWIAALASNVGTWMQTVSAQWLLVRNAHAAILVSLVQTAYTLPAVLFALVGGVLADIFNRATLLVSVLAGMTAVGAALTALTAVGRMPRVFTELFSVPSWEESWSRTCLVRSWSAELWMCVATLSPCPISYRMVKCGAPRCSSA
jgi:MFS family permease